MSIVYTIETSWKDASRLPFLRRTDDDVYVIVPFDIPEEMVGGDVVRLRINNVPGGYRLHILRTDGVESVDYVQEQDGPIVIHMPLVDTIET